MMVRELFNRITGKTALADEALEKLRRHAARQQAERRNAHTRARQLKRRVTRASRRANRAH